MERGEAMNFIHFYMIEKGVSEEEAGDHVRDLMGYLWKKLNKAIIKDSVHAPASVKISLQVIRCVCRYRDFFWHSKQTKSRLCEDNP